MHIDILFFITLFFLGICTSYTDIKNHLILNKHLLIVFFIGIVLLTIKYTFYTVPHTHWMNFLCASILSICFFITKTWRAGDAKLFMLYALLMPPVSSPIIQNFSCIHHIAITFLIGATFLIPFVIQDIIKNKKAILPKILSKNTFELLKDSFFITLAIGWIIFPLIHQLRLFQNPLLSFLFIYILYIVLYSLFDRWTESKWLAISILLFGLALRIFFMPHFFTWHYFLQFITLTLFYSLTFRILFLTISTLQSSKDRIAFAPFLFIGSILSYTNFLQTVIVIIQSMLKH